MANFRCPHCGEENATKVKDSRTTLDGRIIRRKRECHICEGRFNTYEVTIMPTDKYAVVKLEAALQTMSRELELAIDIVKGQKDIIEDRDRKHTKKTISDTGGIYTDMLP